MVRSVAPGSLCRRFRRTGAQRRVHPDTGCGEVRSAVRYVGKATRCGHGGVRSQKVSAAQGHASASGQGAHEGKRPLSDPAKRQERRGFPRSGNAAPFHSGRMSGVRPGPGSDLQGNACPKPVRNKHGGRRRFGIGLSRPAQIKKRSGIILFVRKDGPRGWGLASVPEDRP